MIDLTGTHGTCVTYAEAIKRSGWIPSPEGRAGSGVYFWAYDSWRETARKLAILWWKFGYKKGNYNKADNPAAAVIYARIPVRDEAYFDSTQLQFQEALYEAMHIAGRAEGQAINSDTICKIYEKLILKLEEQLDQKFDVIQAKVPPPPKADFVEKIYVGEPICYIVRSGFNEIDISELEIVGYI